MKQKLSNIVDCNGERIPYNVPIDFTWWTYNGCEVEEHLVAKIRHRKTGDVFEIVKDAKGKDVKHVHRLTALNWSNDDLKIL